jgi:hypothetical protein
MPQGETNHDAQPRKTIGGLIDKQGVTDPAYCVLRLIAKLPEFWTQNQVFRPTARAREEKYRARICR